MVKSLIPIWRAFADKLNRPFLPPRIDEGADDSGFVLTGESTIDLIVEAIRQNQSVVLSGPRGCGKSYCVAAAIKKAQKQALILPGADIFLQGNREFPRDYLMEDAFVLRYDGTNVVPEMRSAPLFKFAQRDSKNKPVAGVLDRQVEMVKLKDNSNQDQTVNRFVLFLDEINRFSDGILDSLLSVLEERKAILAGDNYQLPVVVLMTMNPPGYDGTARRLSPPLQARIGRNWRLYSPDLRTQTDILIPERRRQILATRLERVLARKTAARKPDAGEKEKIEASPEVRELRECLQFLASLLDESKASGHWRACMASASEAETGEAALRKRREELERAVIASWMAEEKDGISPMLCRKAALVCLCLWGMPRADESAHVYLTQETRSMLTELANESVALKDAMEEILELCSYGPDGRAATDWIQSAYSLASREKEREAARKSPAGGVAPESGDDPRVVERHFRSTVIDTLSHKLNDTFSSANEPEKERRKHKAILCIFDEIFSPTVSRQTERRSVNLQRYLNPLLEDERWMSLHASVIWRADKEKEHARHLALRGIFKEAGLLRRVEHERWMGDSPTTLGGFVGAAINEPGTPLSTHAVKSGILVEEPETPPAFSSAAWRDFFTMVCANALFDGDLTGKMRVTLAEVKEVRAPLEAELVEYFPSLRQFGEKNHFALFVQKSGGEGVEWRKKGGRRQQELLLARAFTMVWDQATGLTGDDWHLPVAEELGLNSATPDGEFAAILPQLSQLLEFQIEEASKIDTRSFLFKFTPANWLGRPFQPSNAQFVPGNLSSNSYLRGLQYLLAKIDPHPKTESYRLAVWLRTFIR